MQGHTNVKRRLEKSMQLFPCSLMDPQRAPFINNVCAQHEERKARPTTSVDKTIN